MVIEAGIFSNRSVFDERYINDYSHLRQKVEHIKGIGLKIVLTSGSFDFFHLGHALYLEKAREYGDLLIVGVDSDDKVRRRKGSNRPLYPQEERLHILVRQRSVDIVTLKDVDDEHWQLIKCVCPDVLIATQETYTEEEVAQLAQWCGKVIVLEPQAQTSTSKRLRDLNIELGSEISEALSEAIPELVERVIRDATGRHDKDDSEKSGL